MLMASLLSDSKNTKISNQTRKLKRLLENSNIDIEKMQINFLDQTSNNEYYQLFKERKKDTFTEGLTEADKFGPDLNKVLARDFNFSLLGDMLVKLDRCSMANSLELRSPFLDKDLVDFSFNIPGKEKIGFFSGKKFLKNCYENQLPKWYLTLPKKGFEVPLQKWLQNDLKYLVEEATEKKVLDSLDIKNPNIIFQWKNDFLNGKKDNSWKLWTLISYAYWAKNLKVI
jgi:asparagine synthase (glutamine-hydrolysing)